MVAVAPELTGPPAPVRRRRGGGTVRWGRGVVLGLAAVYFLGPLLAAAWFSVHNSRGFSGHAYTRMTSAPGFGPAVLMSVELGVITMVMSTALVLPTMLLVHLRLPRVRPLIEVLSLFPLVVPPIVLVVGVSKVISWGLSGDPAGARGQVFNQLLNSHPPFVLAFEYVVVVLPFTYRSIDAGLRASAITTLVEAARNLGASWPTVLWRVALPTLRTSVITAAVLAFALVLGEFTMASILQYQPFAVWLLQFGNSDGQLTVALSLMSLVFTWALLVVMTLLLGRTPSRKVRS